MLAPLIVLATASLLECVVIEPHENETFNPSSNGNLEVTCSYENVKTCGPYCFPVDIWIADSNQKPIDGSFVFEVKDEPITVQNQGNGELSCEVILIPECETLEKEPPIPPGELTGGCPSCIGRDSSQIAEIIKEPSPIVICRGTLVGTSTVLTTAECVDGEVGLKLAPISSDNTVKSVIIHPEYDEETKENNLALLKLDNPVSGVKSPCICQKHPQAPTFGSLSGISLSSGPCSLCSNFTKTDACTQVQDRPPFLKTRLFGIGLYTENENDNEELCGVLSSATIMEGDNLDPSSGFTVIELPSFYNWINANIDTCG